VLDRPAPGTPEGRRHRHDVPAVRGLDCDHLDSQERLSVSETALFDERQDADLREQFIAVLGHDLRNPLAAVRTGVKLLEARGLDHGAADYRTWWKVYNDPVLDRLIEIAYAQNLTLLSAGTRVIEARAALGVAIGEFYPGYDATIWLGLFAPAGTPEPIMDRLRAEVGMALASPEVRQKLNTAGGLQPLALKPPEFAALIESDSAKYGKMVRELGITLD